MKLKRQIYSRLFIKTELQEIDVNRKAQTPNTRLAQWGLTSFIETLCFFVTFVLADNLVFQNPPLRQAWERYLLLSDDTANIKLWY
jgi:hypothetical protein